MLPAGTAVGYAALFQGGQNVEGGERDADVSAVDEAHVAVISFAEVSFLAATQHAGASVHDRGSNATPSHPPPAPLLTPPLQPSTRAGAHERPRPVYVCSYH